MEGLLFGLKLGTLIPLIPPFYCQLFPSYRRICTEFRICATVHHSNLYPTDAALSFLSSINTPPSQPPRPPLPPHNVHSNIHFSFCSPFPATSLQLAATATWHGDRLNWKVFCTEGHQSMTLHTEKADSDFVNSHETPWLCPTFISCAENSIQILVWSFEKAPFSDNENNLRVCADACVRGRKCVCVIVYMHTFAMCMFVHLLTCIKGIKALLLDSSFKLPLKLK